LEISKTQFLLNDSVKLDMFDPSKIGSVKEVSFPGVQQFFLFSAKKMKTDLTASKYLMALKPEEILIAELETLAFTQVFKRG